MKWKLIVLAFVFVQSLVMCLYIMHASLLSDDLNLKLPNNNRRLRYDKSVKVRDSLENTVTNLFNSNSYEISSPKINNNNAQKSVKHALKSLRENYPGLNINRGIVLGKGGGTFYSYDKYRESKIFQQKNVRNNRKIYHNIPGMGLGNRLFMYASGYAIAKENNRSYVHSDFNLDTSFFLKARPSYLHRDNLNKYLTLADTTCCIFKSAFFHLPDEDIQLQGFFQSWKYFDKYKSEILKQFVFKSDDVTKQVQKFRNDILKKTGGEQLIGIHIRRGDMTSYNLREYGHKVADLKYLKKAMKYFSVKFKCVFVVCSDDISWSKSALRGQTNVIYSERHSAIFDMQLLTSCDHLIITVGTFGWWSAYLMNGTVVYYKEWPRKNTAFFESVQHDDYFPRHWIPM